MSNDFLCVAITTGDSDGVGFEVTAKALNKLTPQLKTIFFIFRDSNQEKIQKKYFKLIDQKFSRLTFKSLNAAMSYYLILKQTSSLDKNFIFDLELTSSAADWIIDSTKLCKSGFFDSLVTAPISKTLIKKSGYSYMGHTGIFRHFFPQAHLFMCFVGPKFNVLLATDHVSLNNVEKSLTKVTLKNALQAAKNFKFLLRSKKPIAVLGLNPHAGEDGLIGHFENKTLIPQLKLNKKDRSFVGPLSPDAAFLKQNWSKFSIYLALYHDQGLIPFKMQHGQEAGVQLTLGLPFIRTSVDHGTAKDIFNKNLAVASSMLDALKLNLELTRKHKKNLRQESL